MAKAYNEVTVVCEEKDCPYEHQARTISLPLLGQGCYARTPVFCECGAPNEMRIVDETT